MRNQLWLIFFVAQLIFAQNKFPNPELINFKLNETTMINQSIMDIRNTLSDNKGNNSIDLDAGNNAYIFGVMIEQILKHIKDLTDIKIFIDKDKLNSYNDIVISRMNEINMVYINWIIGKLDIILTLIQNNHLMNKVRALQNVARDVQAEIRRL